MFYGGKSKDYCVDFSIDFWMVMLDTWAFYGMMKGWTFEVEEF